MCTNTVYKHKLCVLEACSMCISLCVTIKTDVNAIDLHLHVGVTLQFSMNTFSFSESDGSGYVEVTVCSAPASDFMFTLSQGELGLSQSLSSLPAWTLATVQRQ